MLSKFRKPALAAIILCLLLFALNLTPLKNQVLFYAGRQAGLMILHPFLNLFQKATSGLGGGVRGLLTLRQAQKENSYLKNQVLQLSALNLTLEGLKLENERLRRLLVFKRRSPFGAMAAAEVTGRSPSRWFSTIEINKGRAQGIKPGLVVINESGLVGRVIEAGEWGAKVSLLTDPDSSVSVVDQKTREVGVVSGKVGGSLTLKYIPTSSLAAAGDLLATPGASEIFPGWIPVGQIARVIKRDYDLFCQIEVQPAVNFSRLETVFVILK